MRKVILLVSLLALVLLTAGCVQKQAVNQNKDVANLENELQDVDSLEKELNVTDLGLENDLNLADL